jgi:hypothetical protein
LIEIPQCKVCGTEFDNIFDAVNHLMDDEEEVFDPMLKLPNGYSLLLGSLLEELYKNADDPALIKDITEMTYATLYAAQTDVVQMKGLVEEAIVKQHMIHIDEELKELLNEGDKDGK